MRLKIRCISVCFISLVLLFKSCNSLNYGSGCCFFSKHAFTETKQYDFSSCAVQSLYYEYYMGKLVGTVTVSYKDTIINAYITHVNVYSHGDVAKTCSLPSPLV
jgi:hypothetical protein